MARIAVTDRVSFATEEVYAFGPQKQMYREKIVRRRERAMKMLAVLLRITLTVVMPGLACAGQSSPDPTVDPDGESASCSQNYCPQENMQSRDRCFYLWLANDDLEGWSCDWQFTDAPCYTSLTDGCMYADGFGSCTVTCGPNPNDLDGQPFEPPKTELHTWFWPAAGGKVLAQILCELFC
jgi:hypothetical protein